MRSVRGLCNSQRITLELEVVMDASSLKLHLVALSSPHITAAL